MLDIMNTVSMSCTLLILIPYLSYSKNNNKMIIIIMIKIKIINDMSDNIDHALVIHIYKVSSIK